MVWRGCHSVREIKELLACSKSCAFLSALQVEGLSSVADNCSNAVGAALPGKVLSGTKNEHS